MLSKRLQLILFWSIFLVNLFVKAQFINPGDGGGGGNIDYYIDGSNSALTGDIKTYTVEPQIDITSIDWFTNNANIATVKSTSGFTAEIEFHNAGTSNLLAIVTTPFSVGTFVPLEITVSNGPPPTPANPSIAANNCESATLSRNGNPPSGVTWYWQGKNSNGNSTNLGSGSSFTADEGSGTYYIRARDNDSGLWSTGSGSRSVTMNIIPGIANTPIITNNCGNTVLNRGPDLPGFTSYWQNTANGTSRVNSNTTITLTSGSVYYLRTRNDNAECWGPVRTINYTVDNTGSTWYLDADGDGHAVSTTQSCDSPGTGYTLTVLPLGDCNDDDDEIHPDTIWYLDADGDGYSVSSQQSCSSPGANYVLSVSGTSDCNDNDDSVFQIKTWYLDADGDGHASSSTDSCSNPGPGYTIEILPLDDCDDTNFDPTNNCTIEEIDPPSSNPADHNYVYTRTYQTETATAPNFFTANDNLIQEINYVDGLGRGLQQVGIDNSPNKNDIVTHIEYDSYGRMPKEYLPYAVSGNLGEFNVDSKTATEQYYDIAKYQDTPNPYSEKEFEASPLNRVFKQAAPGEDWKLGNGHEIEFEYQTNTNADGVKLFEVTTSFSNNTYIPTLDDNEEYNTGELYKTVTKDENHTGTSKNHTTEEFTNKQGQVVLKRTYNNNDPHDTYYVYDDFGNLTYVLPPKVTTDDVDAIELNELSYQYVYDHRNRLVEKKIPGKEWEYIIYNRLDQPIMTQDANMRVAHNTTLTSDYWLFTKYDAFGRVAYTGKVNNSDDREVIQNTVSNLSTTLWVNQGNNYNVDNINVNYNNGAYPTNNIIEIHTVNYYDDYDFDRANEPSPPSLIFNQQIDPRTRGLATGSKVRILDESPAQWITTITRYDAKARPIYIYSENEYLNSVDLVTSDLDFVGRPKKVRSSHTKGGNTIVTIDNFTYDHVGRLIKQTQCIGNATLGDSCGDVSAAPANLPLSGTITNTRVATNSITITNATLTPGAHLIVDPTATGGTSGNEELIVYNSYDELGRMQAKKVGGASANSYSAATGLQEVDYSYNVRDWLTGINDINNTNKLFNFSIAYNQGSNPLYNGNIANTKWRTANNDDNSLKSYDYQYDPLNRIIAATDNTGKFNVSGITYDKNGNIETLKREGWTTANPDLAANTGFGTMDNLVYAYDNGNKLTNVADNNASDTYGFKDVNGAGMEYEYDDNGNMISDANKGITSIEYNHLNLPTQVSIANSEHNGNIQYVYDATGVKLEKTTSTGTSTEYCNNYIYENGTLQFFSHPEGYVNAEGNDYEYIYQYKDHLGNVRLSYTDNNGTLEIIEENNYYPFGLEHKGYNNVVTSTNPAQDYKYNGKELNEELGLDWYDYGARNYDATTGRWVNIDPLADKYVSFNPYNYTANNPIVFIDPDGKDIEPAVNQSGTIQQVIQQWQQYGITTIDQIKGFVNNKNIDGKGGNAIRYVYTGNNGWIDLAHYAGVQVYGKTAMDLLEPASGNALMQELFFNEEANNSYFSYEDLPSNAFSSEVDIEGLEGEELYNAILSHFESAGATNPENAPNYEQIPNDDGDRLRLPENTSIEFDDSSHGRTSRTSEPDTDKLKTGNYIPQNRTSRPYNLNGFNPANTSIQRRKSIINWGKTDTETRKTN